MYVYMYTCTHLYYAYILYYIYIIHIYIMHIMCTVELCHLKALITAAKKGQIDQFLVI